MLNIRRVFLRRMASSIPVVEGHSIHDLTLICILTIIGITGLVGSLALVYTISVSNDLGPLFTFAVAGTEDVRGDPLLQTGVQAGIKIIKGIVLVTGTLFASFCGFMLYNVPGMLQTVKQWQTDGEPHSR